MRIKTIKILGFLVLFVCALSSCNRNERFSEIPYIEFVAIEKVDNGGHSDSQADLTIYFQDGDGDIGLDDTDKDPVFSVDSPYYYNFFINFYEKQNGNWVKQEFSTPLHARIPHLSNSVPESIEGKITITTYINNPNSNFDTVRLECFLVDRALHQSDTIVTPEIIVKK